MRSGASRANSARAAVEELHAAISLPDPAFTLVFASPDYDETELGEALRAVFTEAPVIGCKTAGEITPAGYETGTLTGVCFARSHFALSTLLIKPLSEFSLDDGPALALQALERLEMARIDGAAGAQAFAFLMVDGLSRQEEPLVSALAPSLGSIPLFGGSSGDGLTFERTFVIHEGALHADAALLAMIRTTCPFTVLKIDHFEPTDQKMVVTEADPERRLVTEINAEPAAEAYARMVGLDENQLSPFVFAAHPVLVRVGGEYHVRSIQKVEDRRNLRFYCAIDEGLVLTVAQAKDMVAHLDESLTALAAEGGPPEVIIGCDCILRRLEAEQKQATRAVSEILGRHRVIGFSTYGEQYRSMHANQTFTGVALRRPEPAGA